MNKQVLDYLMNRADSRRDRRRDYDDRDYEDGRRRRAANGRFMRDRRDMRDHDDRDYDDRRRGTVDFEGNMDFNDGRRGDYRRDMRDYNDYGDYGHTPRLSKSDMHDWKMHLENADGTRGAHFDMSQVMSAAEKMGIRFDEFDEKELCMTVNMMYSDYCKVAKKFVSPDKEIHFFVELAKAFLCDEDAPEPSEKLALYYHCIVNA